MSNGTLVEVKERLARRWHLSVLLVATVTVVLSFALRVRADQRIELRWLPGYPAPEMCPWRVLTNLDCPACGLTRGFIRIAEANFSAALSLNCVSLPLAVVVLLQFPYRLLILWSSSVSTTPTDSTGTLKLMRRGRSFSLADWNRYARVTYKPDMHTILFDIDGTLLHSGGAGQAAMERTLEVEFGVTAPTDGIPTAGRTDRGITQDLIRFHKLENSEQTHQRFSQAYLRELPLELSSRQGAVFPGVRELLMRLSRRQDVCLGLLTGNYREAAWQKLRHFDLAEHFGFGGYGDDHPHRDDVARQALTAATTFRAVEHIDPARLWVIGDTPADVQCGRAIGARVIAVATGVCSWDELTAAKPDHLFVDFTNVEAVLTLWS